MSSRMFSWTPIKQFGNTNRIRQSVSTVNRTCELSGITHVTPFRKYGKHTAGPSTYGLWVRTYNKLFSCESVLAVCSYIRQSNDICTYGRVSRGSLPRVRRYGLLYWRTVEHDQYSRTTQSPEKVFHELLQSWPQSRYLWQCYSIHTRHTNGNRWTIYLCDLLIWANKLFILTTFTEMGRSEQHVSDSVLVTWR